MAEQPRFFLLKEDIGFGVKCLLHSGWLGWVEMASIYFKVIAIDLQGRAAPPGGTTRTTFTGADYISRVSACPAPSVKEGMETLYPTSSKTMP